MDGEWMDGWMGGWVDGWTCGWVDGWTCGWMAGWAVAQVRVCDARDAGDARITGASERLAMLDVAGLLRMGSVLSLPPTRAPMVAVMMRQRRWACR